MRIFLVLLIAIASMFSIADGQAKHPGQPYDCSTKTDKCTEWTILDPLEWWKETEARSGKSSATEHEIEFWDPGTNAASRWARSTISVRSGNDGTSTVTTQVLFYHFGDSWIKETCQKNDLPRETAETHTFEQVTGILTTKRYYLQWSHDSSGEHLTKKSWQKSEGYVDDASVKDTTRCAQSGFPFAFVRDPNIKPL